MLTDLSCDCESCGRPLAEPALTMRTEGGERRAYECACGEVTVTVAR
jgi:hypothetical protein